MDRLERLEKKKRRRRNKDVDPKLYANVLEQEKNIHEEKIKQIETQKSLRAAMELKRELMMKIDKLNKSIVGMDGDIT